MADRTEATRSAAREMFLAISKIPNGPPNEVGNAQAQAHSPRPRNAWAEALALEPSE